MTSIIISLFQELLSLHSLSNTIYSSFKCIFFTVLVFYAEKDRVHFATLSPRWSCYKFNANIHYIVYKRLGSASALCCSICIPDEIALLLDSFKLIKLQCFLTREKISWHFTRSWMKFSTIKERKEFTILFDGTYRKSLRNSRTRYIHDNTSDKPLFHFHHFFNALLWIFVEKNSKIIPYIFLF